MPIDVEGLLPYFYKKSVTVLTGYAFDIDGDGEYDTYYVANNEDVGGGGTTYTALAIKRGTITCEDGTVLNEVEIGLDNTDLAFKQWVLGGKLERKKCQIRLLFCNGTTVLGSVLIFYGLMDAPKGDENWVTLTIRPMAALEREYPRRIYQVGCNWLFGNGNCGISLGDYDYDGTLSAESDGITLTISHGQAENYFLPGYVHITDGDYFGEVRPILANSISTVTCRVGFGHTIPNGTAIKVQKLCAKNPDACQNIYDNYVNYGGFPHVPKAPII